jgi:DNA-binding MarR family transcriptional regulator
MSDGGTRRKDPGKSTAGAATRNAPDDPESISVALALLKYFYWIEIGIRSYLRSRDNLELSRSEGLVIATVMLGYQRPSDIARQLGVSRQAIHVTIGQMKKKGFVDLAPDPHDGRIKQVVLTPLAAQMNADGVVAMDHLWQELGRRVGKADLNRLAKVLRADWGPPVIFDEDKAADPWVR